MIVDHIRNRAIYAGLGEDYRRALDFLAALTENTPCSGDLTVPGTDISVKVRPITTRKPDLFEAHDRFADIHFLLSGTERIGYADRASLKIEKELPADDAVLLSGEGDFVTMRPGDFMIALPDDAHMPSVMTDRPETVTKVVVKIRVQ